MTKGGFHMPIHDEGNLFGSFGGVQMPARSGAKSAGGANLGPLEATKNTIYLPIRYNLDGFDRVTVNVPPIYTRIHLAASGFSEALHVTEAYPQDGTQTGESLLDVINERLSLSGDAMFGNGELFVLLNIPESGQLKIRAPVFVTRSSSGGADIFCGSFDSNTNHFSMRLSVNESASEVPQLVGASGSMNGMTIDTATFAQLMQTATDVQLTIFARAKAN